MSRLYVSDSGNWGIINEEPFGFALIECEDWTEDDFRQLDNASDSDKLLTALAIRRLIDDENEQVRTNWDSLTGKLDELLELARELQSIELRSLAIDIREAVGL